MTPRRRLAVIAVAALTSLGGSTLAASAADSTGPATPATQGDRENRYGDWWCVWVEDLQTAVCGGDPLPPRLPLPEDRPRL